MEGVLREIGGQAVWSVDSFKTGNGVEMLRDGRTDTYWQSDGHQPHLVNIQFAKKMRIREILLYVDFKLDESYTPHKISVRCGTSTADLQEIKVIELDKPCGWSKWVIGDVSESGVIRACLLQLAVLSNFQNGRDSHIRQIKVYGPPTSWTDAHPLFSTPEFLQFSELR
eukprot:gnl/Spiro4/23468_TR11602_c0_g1_i1.p1 gnl/Spiro4/23468_TR11602_c0_g1~~gnl/Spiro4/23468_TR11602_c0_g1_i1.p1  ORF type:complete len:169 (+),score=19.21 gnl/Spiro4/23468_TR11602_c0_g1_i1:141-647(+)